MNASAPMASASRRRLVARSGEYPYRAAMVSRRFSMVVRVLAIIVARWASIHGYVLA